MASVSGCNLQNRHSQRATPYCHIAHVIDPKRTETGKVLLVIILLMQLGDLCTTPIHVTPSLPGLAPAVLGHAQLAAQCPAACTVR